MRANRCEVSEFFRIDFGKRCRSQIFNEMFDGCAGSVGGVIPASKGGDDMGSTQFRSTDPTDVF
jgi:hypothetical protein